MVSTRNQTNPKYSFGKEERFSNLINKNILSYIKKLEEQKLINLDNINNNNLDLQKKLSKCLEIKNLSPFRSNNSKVQTDFLYSPASPVFYKFSHPPKWGSKSER